jgi:hypothetical protein
MMANAYVVTSGAYSDYRIIGVYSTRAAAEAFCRWHNGPIPDEAGASYDAAEVEEYEMDAPVAGQTGAFRFTRILTFRGDRWVEARYGAGPARWDMKASPAPASYAVAKWDTDKLQVTACAETPEHARRSVDELVRAILTGVHIPDLPPTP